MIRNKQPRDLVDEYVQAVRSGERPACAAEVAAIDRHFSDLDEASKRGLYFDEDIATEACLFFPHVLRHSIGEWQGEPFFLDPWQAWLVWCIQGWRNADDKTRRFTRAYVTVGRKNGKTTWAAGMALALSYFDHPLDPGMRGYCAATKLDQAVLLWSEAARMIKQSPDLNDCSRVKEYKHLIEIPELPGYPHYGGEFKAVAADGKKLDGLNPSFVLCDELHEWAAHQRKQFEKLATAGGSRRQPLVIYITTAGDDNSTLWQEVHDYATRVAMSGAAGKEIDDTFFPYIAQLEAEDDPFEPANWPKANPNYGVSLKPKYLRAQAAEAANKPSAENQFIRYHGNRRVSSLSTAFGEALWSEGNQEYTPPEDGDVCYGGFDLARSDDWMAAALVFPHTPDGAEQTQFRVMVRCWACQGANASIDYSQPPFSTWIREGLLEFQPGNEVLDFAPLRHWFAEAQQKYNLRQVNYDATYAGETGIHLQEEYGINVRDMHQTPKNYTEPIVRFLQCLRNGQIAHGADPVLAWQAMNSELIHQASTDYVMIKKSQDDRSRKVDGIVSMLMAFEPAIYADGLYSSGTPFMIV
jgi:phage terminase large subunit-like protein